jgi:hypothetical protein
VGEEKERILSKERRVEEEEREVMWGEVRRGRERERCGGEELEC